MKRIAFILALLGCIAPRAMAQYNHQVNMSLTAGYSLTYGNMSNYYDGGFAVNMRTITSISKRKSDLRIGVQTNIGYYRFNGKVWYDFASGYSYKSTSFGAIPVHAGLRLDFGHTRQIPVGMYVAQDFGLTYVDGQGGGSRYGHTFEIGGLIGRFDMEMAFHIWQRSHNAGNFRYFTVGIGVVLF